MAERRPSKVFMIILILFVLIYSLFDLFKNKQEMDSVLKEKTFHVYMTSSSFNGDDLSNLKLRMNCDIDLEGNWDVALKEISLTNNIQTLNKNTDLILINKENNQELKFNLTRFEFNSVTDIVKEINSQMVKLKDAFQAPKFIFPEGAKNLRILVTKGHMKNWSFQTSSDFRNILKSNGGELKNETNVRLYSIFYNTDIDLKIPAKSYSSSAELVSSLNKIVLEFFDLKSLAELKYDQTNIWLEMNEFDEFELIIPEQLAYIFHIDKLNIGKNKIHHSSEKFYPSPRNIFVYSDIIKPSLVNGTLSNLLKTFSFPQNISKREQITITFPNLIYVPLNTKKLRDISVQLRDDSNFPISFKSGMVVITLEFKKF